MGLMFAVVIGLLAGISSGLFGIGGGVVIMPLLIFGMRLSQVEAIGTSLIALLLPVGSLGVYRFYQAGYLSNLNFKIGFLISLGMIFGTFFGAKIATSIDTKLLSKIFAIFLFLISIKVWRN